MNIISFFSFLKKIPYWLLVAITAVVIFVVNGVFVKFLPVFFVADIVFGAFCAAIVMVAYLFENKSPKLFVLFGGLVFLLLVSSMPSVLFG